MLEKKVRTNNNNAGPSTALPPPPPPPPPQEEVPTAPSSSSTRRQVKESYKTLNRRYRVLTLADGDISESTLTDFIGNNETEFNHTVSDMLGATRYYKVQFAVRVEFKKPLPDNGEEVAKKEWQLSNASLPFNDTFLKEGAQRLDEKIANYSSLSSNWSLNRILRVELVCHEYHPLKSVSGHSYIPTPPELECKHAIVNVRNTQDSFCFLYAVLSILKYATISMHRYRPSKYYQYLEELTFSEEQMPMKLNGIAKFERDNNLSIHVIKYVKSKFRRFTNDSSTEDDDIVRHNEDFHICYRSGNLSNATHHVKLLLVEEN